MLAGAHYGEGAIPFRWLRRLDKVARTAIEVQVQELLALAAPNS